MDTTGFPSLRRKRFSLKRRALRSYG